MNNLDVIKARLDYEYERLSTIKAVLEKYLAAYLVLVNRLTVEAEGGLVEYKAVENKDGVIKPAKFTAKKNGSIKRETDLKLDELMHLVGEITMNKTNDWTRL